MPAFNGKDLIVKIGNGASPEVFTTIAALKTASFSNGRNTVDITNKDSAGWRELLGTAAISSATINGSGVFTDAASQESVRAANFSGALKNLRFYYGSNDYIGGAFVITNFEMNGGFDDAQAFSFTAESSGVITQTPGA